MKIDKEMAMKFWDKVYGNVEYAKDCFGTYMCKNAYSNVKVILKRPGCDEKYDYSWNIDHIRPKNSFKNENDADFENNYEPMHRQNNEAKSDNYPEFEIGGKRYFIVEYQNPKGLSYGIKNADNERIDWKGKRQR